MVVTALGYAAGGGRARGHADRSRRSVVEHATRATDDATDRVPDDAQRAAAALRDRQTGASTSTPRTRRASPSPPVTADRSRSTPASARPSTCASTAAAAPASSTAAAARRRRRPADVEPPLRQRARRSGRDLRHRDRGRRSRRVPAVLRRPRPVHDATRPPAATARSACPHEEIPTWCPATAAAPRARSDTDPDCSPTCRNGVVDPGETCDTRDHARRRRRLPDRIRVRAGCGLRHRMLVSAGTCSAVCVRYPDRRQSGKCSDGCCPPGATNAVDDDCPTACGNGRDAMRARTATSASRRSRPAPARPPATTASRAPSTSSRRSAARPPASTSRSPRPSPATAAAPWTTTESRPPTARPDTDCPPSCGNGIVEPGETCDGDCPTSCPPPPVGYDWLLGCLRAELVGRRGRLLGPLRDHGGDRLRARSRTAAVPPAAPSDDRPGLLPCGAATARIDFTSGEECDTGAPPGDPSSCPTSCADSQRAAPTIAWSARGPAAALCVSPADHRASVPATAAVPQTAPTSSSIPTAPPCAATASSRARPSAATSPSLGRARSQRTCPQQMRAAPATPCRARVACSATCVAMPITAAADGDGCCPPGSHRRRRFGLPASSAATAWSSNRESCDRAITAGTPGACPRSCDDGIACTVDFASGLGRGVHADLHPPADHRLRDGRRLLSPGLLGRQRRATATRAAATGASARARPAIPPAPARPPARTTATRARGSS